MAAHAESGLTLRARIAVVGNYLPRQCGIATFTTDLCDAICTKYRYPARVHFELEEGDLSSYLQAAAFLNFSNVDLVCPQHEYGIFGAEASTNTTEMFATSSVPAVIRLQQTAMRSIFIMAQPTLPSR